MRISDWSSDVCSWDHGAGRACQNHSLPMKQSGHNIESGTSRTVAPAFAIAKAGAVADNTKGRIQITEFSMQAQHIIAAASAATGLSAFGDRSEARRVGKEWCRTGRSRGS